jgi:signal peptidase
MVWRNKVKFCILGILCAIAILSTYFLASLSNASFLVVVSESMEPTLYTGDIVIIGQSDNAYSSFKDVKVGDIIAFEESGKTESGRNKIIVHRVVQISDSPYGDTIVTKGDANPYPIQFVDFPITNDDYVGRVDYIIPYIGLVLIYIDILVRVAFPPMLYILIAIAAGVLIVIKVSRRKGLLI